jgi:hypothetical protein
MHMKRILSFSVGMLSIALEAFHSKPADANPRWRAFPAEYKGVSANIIAYSGVNGQQARLVAVTQESNIIEFCVIQRPPEEFRDCYRRTMVSHAGIKYQMYADCLNGVIKTHWDKTYQLIGTEWQSSGDNRSPRKGWWRMLWRDLDTGKAIENSIAGGTYEIALIHHLLCPDNHPNPSIITIDSGF